MWLHPAMHLNNTAGAFTSINIHRSPASSQGTVGASAGCASSPPPRFSELHKDGLVLREPGKAPQILMPLALYLAAEQCGRDRLAQIEGLNHELGEKFEHITALEQELHFRELRHKEDSNRLEYLVARLKVSEAQVATLAGTLKATECERDNAWNNMKGLSSELALYKAAAPMPDTFIGKIAQAINYHSRESGSNTPDFILAEYMNNCLGAFDTAMRARAKWCSCAFSDDECMTQGASAHRETVHPSGSGILASNPDSIMSFTPPQDMDGSEPSRFGR